MRRSILVLAAAMTVGVPMTPSHAAGSASATYVAGAGVKQSVERSAQGSGIHVGIGGARIGIPEGTKPVSITVNDDVGAGKIHVLVCQVTLGQCGDDSSVYQGFCLTDNVAQELPVAKPWGDQPVHIWVHSGEALASIWMGSVSCSDGAAVAGTITVDYA